MDEAPRSGQDVAARRGDAEAAIRSLLRQGRPSLAARDALDAYGAEVFGFLVAVLEDRDAAAVAYANASARIRRLESFPASCSVRTCVYAVARRELARSSGSIASTGAGRAHLDDEGPAPLRTISRRPVAHRLAAAALRKRLERDDRELLVLHLDRGFDWRAMATIMLGWGAGRIELLREAKRLRARMRELRDALARMVEPHAPESS